MQIRLLENGLRIEVYQPGSDISNLIITQMVQNSLQKHIVATTPRDSSERFSSEEAFYRWFTEGKLLLALINTYNSELAGLAWFSRARDERAEGASYTYAHRLYNGYIGKGLSVPFAIEAHDIARQYIGTGPFWLSVLNSNAAAIRTYEQIGYSVIAEDSARSIMVRAEG